MPTHAPAAASSWLIERECPQCGAPVALHETDRILDCRFCRTRLIIAPRGIVRTCLPPRDRDPADLILVPYWRLRGAFFRCAAGGVTHRFVDATRRAVDLPRLPLSLGIRPQAVPLRFVTDETPGRVLRSNLSLREAASAFADQRDDEGGTLHRAFIGETMSLVHLPIRVGRTIRDAVNDDPLPDLRVEDLEAAQSDPDPQFGIDFLPCLCPNCGWDFESGPESCAHFCGHCQTAWELTGGRLRPVTVRFSGAAVEADAYLPFRRIELTATGIDLATMRELRILANLPVRASDLSSDAPAAFWSPAFKLRSDVMLRLAKQITLRQPEVADRPLPRIAVHSVSMPESESLEMLPIALADLAARKPAVISLLDDLSFEAKRSEIVLVPVRLSAIEMTSPELGFTLDRRLVELGRFL